jgi:hypothetical protein
MPAPSKRPPGMQCMQWGAAQGSAPACMVHPLRLLRGGKSLAAPASACERPRLCDQPSPRPPSLPYSHALRYRLGQKLAKVRKGMSSDATLDAGVCLAPPASADASKLRSPRSRPRQDLVGVAFNSLLRPLPRWQRRTFTHPNCTIPSRYPEFGALLAAQAAHDPDLVFEPQLFTRIKRNEPYG